ncbi:hypothetical protein OUZ56_000586 [Daphnia magna]|uniref:Uncharacterized protein n=1 Tax=Daphnia magna TaxID=35525 RepID=A0ABR0A0B8_9CRUS|nr:hypothetical protein OUZ56_000586 [Daphnia magna]
MVFNVFVPTISIQVTKVIFCGKPSYLYLDNDVDWVPSKNLSNLQQHEESGIENVADCSLQPQILTSETGHFEQLSARPLLYR